MANHPNILLFLTDQQTISAMSWAGNPHLATPAMDSLAAKGVRFTKSWCPSPVCGPARASIFCGQMPHQVGVDFNSSVYVEGTRTIGQNFREAGYQTPYIGKWHVHECYPHDRTYIAGFDNIPITEVDRTHLGENVDEFVAEKAKTFLKQPQETPFFLAVSLLNPHDICYHIMEDNEDKLARFRPKPNDELPPLPDNFAIPDGEPQWLQIRRKEDNYGKEPSFIYDWDERRFREYLYTYYRLTERVDQHIATVLDTLATSSHADNTIIVFTSDHGESVAAHQLVVKLTPYEEALSVPLIVYDPRCQNLGGTVNSSWHVSGVDIAPTLLELAGIDPEPQHTGRSFAPALQGKKDPRGYVVAEVYPSPRQPNATARAIRQDKWKYTAYQSDYGFEERLVNLDDDPGELQDLLIGDTANEIRDMLRASLRIWLTKTNDPFPVMNIS